jgi:hypothetical protein
LAVAAERLPEISRTAHDLLKGIVQEAEQRFMMQDFDGARQILVEEAARFLAEQRPLLAACLLSRTLRLPGPSARAYHQLGLAARQASCPREAAQFYKTGSWLALKAQDGELARAILADLEALSPADPWLAKARDMLTADPLPGQEQRCSFCGRTAQEAGPLIAGTAAAVCSGCVRRMMTLDQNRH